MARRNSNGGVTGHGNHFTRTVIGDSEPYTDSVQQSSVGYKHLKYDDANAILIDDSQHASSSTLPTISGTMGQSPQYQGLATNKQQPLQPQSQYSFHQFASQPARYFYPATAAGHSAPGLGQGHYGANLAHNTNQNVTENRSKSFAGRVFADFMNTATTVGVRPTEIRRTSPTDINRSPTSGPPSPPVSDESLLPPPCSESLCVGIRELLASLGLMCILSLLMAFLALFFLHKSCPVPNFVEETTVQTLSSNNASKTYRTYNSNAYSTNAPQRLVSNAKEYNRVYQISVSLSILTIALDLCCLFVSCVQFLAIVKLIKNPYGKMRSLEFIKKTSHIRIVAIGAFLLSIPIFFTGIILYTFVNFDELPALITSLVIGCGIIFCGIASVQNVYLWQWEKTKASEDARYARRQLPYRSLNSAASSHLTSSPARPVMSHSQHSALNANHLSHHHHHQNVHHSVQQQQQQQQPQQQQTQQKTHLSSQTASQAAATASFYAPQTHLVQDHLSTLV